jgi:sulfite reductase (ferredoxin)
MFLGIAVDNGRIKDEGDFQLKSALRKLVQAYRLPMLLTPSQNIILYDIQPADQPAIAQLLKAHGVKREDELPILDRYAMACPALPMCGLATTEAERVMPSLLDRLTKLLKKVGLPKEQFITRVTGCPNGCARPYLAELGLVGNGPDLYQLWLGACPNQTRLSQVYLEKMPIADLEKTLEPILVCFKQHREKDESLGDFCHRYGFEALSQFAETYEPTPRRRRAPDHRRRVTVRDDIFGTLLETAKERNQSMTDIVDEAIKSYLNIQPTALAPGMANESTLNSDAPESDALRSETRTSETLGSAVSTTNDTTAPTTPPAAQVHNQSLSVTSVNRSSGTPSSFP